MRSQSMSMQNCSSHYNTLSTWQKTMTDLSHNRKTEIRCKKHVSNNSGSLSSTTRRSRTGRTRRRRRRREEKRSNCNWQTVEAATTYPEIHENKKNEVAIINNHENCANFFLFFYFLESRSNLQSEWRKWDFENKRFGEDRRDFCSDGEDGKKTHTHTHTAAQERPQKRLRDGKRRKPYSRVRISRPKVLYRLCTYNVTYEWSYVLYVFWLGGGYSTLNYFFPWGSVILILIFSF